MRWRAMLTSIETGPLAFGFVREANVVGTGSLAFGLVVTGFEPGFVVTGGASVVTEAGGAVGAAVVTGAALEAGVVTGGTVVTGAAVTGALVEAGAIEAGAVVGEVVGIVGYTSVGAGVSCPTAASTVPAKIEALTISTPKRDLLTRRVLLCTGRGDVFTT
jgi:hypothetical protein